MQGGVDVHLVQDSGDLAFDHPRCAVWMFFEVQDQHFLEVFFHFRGIKEVWFFGVSWLFPHTGSWP